MSTSDTSSRTAHRFCGDAVAIRLGSALGVALPILFCAGITPAYADSGSSDSGSGSGSGFGIGVQIPIGSGSSGASLLPGGSVTFVDGDGKPVQMPVQTAPAPPSTSSVPPVVISTNPADLTTSPPGLLPPIVPLSPPQNDGVVVPPSLPSRLLYVPHCVPLTKEQLDQVSGPESDGCPSPD
jgi:hypothetical protein